jgi:hypothetical protein
MFAVYHQQHWPRHGHTDGSARNTVRAGYVSFTAVPDPGYRASAQTTCGVNGFTVGGNQFTTRSPVTADCSITVSFTAITPQFTITPIAGAHGRISPAAPRSRLHGRTYRATVTPDAGYGDRQRHRLRRHAEQQWQVRDRGGERDCSVTATFALATAVAVPTGGVVSGADADAAACCCSLHQRRRHR